MNHKLNDCANNSSYRCWIVKLHVRIPYIYIAMELSIRRGKIFNNL